MNISDFQLLIILATISVAGMLSYGFYATSQGINGILMSTVCTIIGGIIASISTAFIYRRKRNGNWRV